MASIFQLNISAQSTPTYTVPSMPDPAARLANIKHEWAAVQMTTPQLSVRDCFMFLLDALDTKFLQPEQVEWLLKKVQTRMITDPAAGRSYGNIFWGWNETGFDVGDGNNVQFCVQYGILIKMLFDDRLSDAARKTLDEIFLLAYKGALNQEVRISYTNIYLMKIWNLVALGQVYNKPAITDQGRQLFDTWLNHVAHYGNREYDSPTYCGVDLESLLLLHTFSKDADIKTKAGDALSFLLTDLSAHYNQRAGVLGGAHSRDYNRVFSRDLLEEKYMNPLLGRPNNNTHLFHQVCTVALQQLGLSAQQKELMNRKSRFIIQRWDSLPNAYAVDFVGNKFAIASSNQAYSPDDKPFVMYLSSASIPAMPNIAFVMEGRDDHYGTWSAEGKGEKMKHLMPANYPANGGWNKTRHLMPFMQSAQNKGEMVMLVSGVKDHNCINDYLNSTVILPDYFDEMWTGNKKISIPAIGGKANLDKSKTFFARFEDVAIAFRYLFDDAASDRFPALYNDGFTYTSARENFELKHNKTLRLTLSHSNNGKAAVAMWWKAEEGIKTDAEFKAFRQKVLNAPLTVKHQNGLVDVSVQTSSGKLGVKADLINKIRVAYYNPSPLPKAFLFNVDGKEIGMSIMDKYKQKRVANLLASKNYTLDSLLIQDNFETLQNHWILETQADVPAKLSVQKHALVIDAKKDATVWFSKNLSGNVLIECNRKVIMEDGPNDRLSDMNFFWMASDPHNSNLFTRTGLFKEYDALQLYYAGIGGNSNTTSRFRRYEGKDGKNVIKEFTDKAHLLQHNKNYRVRILMKAGETRFWIDDELYFSYKDPEPLKEGYFGFRTTKSRQEISDFKVYRVSD